MTKARLAPAHHRHARFGVPLLMMASLAGCGSGDEAHGTAPVVLVQTAALAEQRPEIMLTGAIAAETLSNLGFRLGGRVVKRHVDVGDHVAKDQVLAALDPEKEQADVAAAEAGVRSAEAALRQAQANFDRQAELLRSGHTTRAAYDDASEQLQSAKATLDSATAQLGVARDNLANTELKAEAAGVITARNVEVGQVVEPAQVVFTLAQDGARDAVFDIHEAVLARPTGRRAIQVILLSDPSVRVTGTVRDVSPVIDPETGTIRVKVALPPDLPPAMALGTPIAGVGAFDAGKAVAVPWTALANHGGAPAVFVVDPAQNIAAARPIVVAGYRTGTVLVGEGLQGGELVVTAGTQLVRSGDRVEPRAAATGAGS